MTGDCLICRKAGDEENRIHYLPHGLYLYESKYFRVRHSDETKIAGYLIIESKRHFLDLSEATEEEAAEFGVELARVVRAVRRVTHPKRVYTFSLAEAVPHFHVHVIPRDENLPARYVGRGILSYPLQPALNESTRDELSLALRRVFKALS